LDEAVIPRRAGKGLTAVLNIGFFKGQPTEYIIKYTAGKLAAEGQGLAFWYWKHKTQIVVVPTASTDAQFVFNEVAGDYQEVTLQGQFAYRIHEPKQAASLLNFGVDPGSRIYLSDGFERLPQRITNVIQTEMRNRIRSLPLEEALREAQMIATEIQAKVSEAGLLAPMGVELLGIHVLSARPTPEVAKALEAEYRESLLLKADEAIYARRAESVEKERRIKENELNTEIALEQQRERLIDLRGENIQREADHRGRALEREAHSRARTIELEAAARAKAMELETEVSSGVDASKILALALRELSANADKLLAAMRRPQRPESNVE
jgi:hypothetical protein